MINQADSTVAPGALADRGNWLDDPAHLAWLRAQAAAHFAFFAESRQGRPGFALLDHDGTPLRTDVQELHTTTRMIHSYSLGMLTGVAGAADIVDHGMAFLTGLHRDPLHGGYVWSVTADGPADDRKLAYGHVFVLLAAASAKMAGHPDADALLADIVAVLDAQFWEAKTGRFSEEYHCDWSPLSNYRGMNANMHGVEALLAAYEATGEQVFLTRAGQITDFFVHQMAPAHRYRLPEHFTADWQVDPDYAGNHMFRPAGTTPGHSFELARLTLQHWDLSGRPESGALGHARAIIEQALDDAWLPAGGFAYTLGQSGSVADGSRFWWPVTEAITALATLIRIEGRDADMAWYRKLWQFADAHFIDHARGGWYPAIDDAGAPTGSIFTGKPDIYHSLQACLFPGTGRISRMAGALPQLS